MTGASATSRIVSIALWAWVIGMFMAYAYQYSSLLPAISAKLGLAL